jgi:hypothetical protein
MAYCTKTIPSKPEAQARGIRMAYCTKTIPSKPEAQARGIRVHAGCYFAGGRTNIPSAVSWITGIASFGSKTP